MPTRPDTTTAHLTPARDRAPGRRVVPGRRVWWILTLSLLMLLVVVAVGQHYRTTLRGSAERLAQTMRLAEDRQQAMAARLREAEAALAAARPTGPPAETGNTDPAQRLIHAANDLERLAATIAANANAHRPTLPDRIPAPGLQQALAGLARDAMHLPTMRHRAPPGVPAAPVLLRGSDLGTMLNQAQDAAALGDLMLVQRLLADARRLLGWFRQEPRALALAARLEALRHRLEANPDPDPAASLRWLAADLRAVAAQWPATNPAPTAGVATGPLPGAGAAPVPAPAPSSRAQR